MSLRDSEENDECIIYIRLDTLFSCWSSEALSVAFVPVRPKLLLHSCAVIHQIRIFLWKKELFICTEVYIVINVHDNLLYTWTSDFLPMTSLRCGDAGAWWISWTSKPNKEQSAWHGRSPIKYFFLPGKEMLANREFRSIWQNCWVSKITKIQSGMEMFIGTRSVCLLGCLIWLQHSILRMEPTDILQYAHLCTLGYHLE